MGANEGTTENKRYFKLIAKAEKAEPNGKIAIVENVKKGDKYEHGKWFASISGFITGISSKEYEYEGEKKTSYSITLMDFRGTYQLDFSLNFATFGLINALLNTDLSKEVEISAWIGKTGYVGAGVKYLGASEQIKWAVELKDQPQGEKYKTPSGKIETDYTKVKTFWGEKFMSLQSKASRNNFKGNVSAPAIQANANFDNEPAHIADKGDDDLPF
jgi:hypothetical protein